MGQATPVQVVDDASFAQHLVSAQPQRALQILEQHLDPPAGRPAALSSRAARPLTRRRAAWFEFEEKSPYQLQDQSRPAGTRLARPHLQSRSFGVSDQW